MDFERLFDFHFDRHRIFYSSHCFKALWTFSKVSYGSEVWRKVSSWTPTLLPTKVNFVLQNGAIQNYIE